MKAFGILLLAALACSAPTSKESEKFIITKELFPDTLAVYTSQHDIVNLFVPLNALNFEEDTDSSEDDSGTTLFFVEADIKNDGQKDYKGLYVLQNGRATKLLDNGRDFAATNDDTKHVYFAATDGIYTYNSEKNTAEKYGTLTDSIINIAQENGTDVLYILTTNKELYRVVSEGTEKERVSKVENAEEIVLDYSNNLYFYGADNKPHVLVDNEIVEIKGLPENPTHVKLLRPAFIIDDGVPFISDDKVYYIYANGTSEVTDFELQTKPTAYSIEATLIQYYAYNKKIYEYNILALILGNAIEELSTYLSSVTDDIQSIATRSRNDLKA